MQGCAGPTSHKYIKNVNITTLQHTAIRRAGQGLIDAVENVARGRYFLYRGEGGRVCVCPHTPHPLIPTPALPLILSLSFSLTHTHTGGSDACYTALSVGHAASLFR